MAPTRMCMASANKCREAGRDRKSTRLNSSHSQISYAVFCLKKKNKIHTTVNCVTTHLLYSSIPVSDLFFFFFNDTATTEIYTLSLHDALPISRAVFRLGMKP